MGAAIRFVTFDPVPVAHMIGSRPPTVEPQGHEDRPHPGRGPLDDFGGKVTGALKPPLRPAGLQGLVEVGEHHHPQTRR